MRLSKKFAAIAITATVALTATAAFAYWSTTGSGTGQVTAASSNGTLVLHGAIGDGALAGPPPVAGHAPYPGGSNPVTFTADNAGASTLYVGTISLLATGGVTTNNALCDASAFTMDPVTSNSTVASGTGQAVAGTGTLVFANSGSDQNACKGAIITLHLQSN